MPRFCSAPPQSGGPPRTSPPDAHPVRDPRLEAPASLPAWFVEQWLGCAVKPQYGAVIDRRRDRHFHAPRDGWTLLALHGGALLLATSARNEALAAPVRLLIPPGKVCDLGSSQGLRGWEIGFTVLAPAAAANPLHQLAMPAVIPGPLDSGRWGALIACFDTRYKPGGPGQALRARLLLDAELAASLVDGFASGALVRRVDACAPDWLDDLATWIYRNAVVADIDLRGLAARAGVSVSALTAAFRRHHRESPMAFLRRQRIHLAARLLRERGDLPIAVIAERCRFGSASLLGRHFRRVMGRSPRTWRRQGGAGTAPT